MVHTGMLRGFGAPLLPWFGEMLARIEPNAARQVADFHTLYNLSGAVLFIGLP